MVRVTRSQTVEELVEAHGQADRFNRQCLRQPR